MSGPIYCAECEQPMRVHQGTASTLVGYSSPKGHNHDDNCRFRLYECPAGHFQRLTVQNRCDAPECKWRGKLTCFCHEGAKLFEWPEAEEIPK